ncbi:MAG: glycosyltransferase family 2 protein, partial [Verrucomicrobiae bacterium]|nr:glycosyltransferase family 2 protein [Verrucomicrobiae bacterium]
MLVLLSFYGAHRLWMLFLYYRHRHDRPQPLGRFETPPLVTVQLPVYNEPCVVERLLDAMGRLEYPRDRLEIQVLDDSTDETPQLVQSKVRALRAAGWNIQHLRRPHRQGFKAGALQYGLEHAKGELIAIFDADFVPPPDLLQRTVDFFTDPQVGMVQLRWGHLNDQQSLLTRVQSILIDGHFLIEQTARSRSGRFFNFNGTAGLWRRQCIEDAGGWSADTLAEDLDLSYRAQLRGWKFLFLPDVVVPAELPVEMAAFKTQQHRWAKGAIQTCKKLLPSVWRSSLPWKIKLEATIHLTSNFGYVMLVILCLLCRAPAAANALHMAGGHWWMKLLFVDVPLFFAATVSVVAFYILAQRELHVRWWERLAYVPLMMAVGVGLSLNNARG